MGAVWTREGWGVFGGPLIFMARTLDPRPSSRKNLSSIHRKSTSDSTHSSGHPTHPDRYTPRRRPIPFTAQYLLRDVDTSPLTRYSRLFGVVRKVYCASSEPASLRGDPPHRPFATEPTPPSSAPTSSPRDTPCPVHQSTTSPPQAAGLQLKPPPPLLAPPRFQSPSRPHPPWPFARGPSPGPGPIHVCAAVP